MTEPNTTAPAPVTGFDLEAWLFDADLPQQSATVFKAGRLPAEAGALKESIEIERGRLDQESSAADKSKVSKLETRYAAVLQEWLDSKITVYVTAIPKDKLRRMREAHDKATDGMTPAVANELFGYELLSAAIIGIAEPGKEYVDEDGNPVPYGAVKLKTNQLRGMEKKIGATQMQLIVAARQTAQNGLPEVDADFLLESSGQNEATTQD